MITNLPRPLTRDDLRKIQIHQLKKLIKEKENEYRNKHPRYPATQSYTQNTGQENRETSNRKVLA